MSSSIYDPAIKGLNEIKTGNFKHSNSSYNQTLGTHRRLARPRRAVLEVPWDLFSHTLLKRVLVLYVPKSTLCHVTHYIYRSLDYLSITLRYLRYSGLFGLVCNSPVQGQVVTLSLASVAVNKRWWRDTNHEAADSFAPCSSFLHPQWGLEREISKYMVGYK